MNRNFQNYTLKARELSRKKCIARNEIASPKSLWRIGRSAKRVGATGESLTAHCCYPERCSVEWTVCHKRELIRNRRLANRSVVTWGTELCQAFLKLLGFFKLLECNLLTEASDV